MNQLPALPLVDGALIVSSSFFDVMACPRAQEYNKLHQRVTATPSMGLQFGSILHKAFEMHYRAQEFTDDQNIISGKVVAVLSEEFAKAQALFEEGNFRTLNWAIEIYQQFARRFQFENFKLLQFDTPIACPQCRSIMEQDKPKQPCAWCNGTGKQSLMVEVPFVVKLFEYDNQFSQFDKAIPIYFQGYIDLPVLIDDRLFVLDFKTSFDLGKSFFEEKRMSAQQKSYCLGLQQTTGKDVAGYIVRAFRTKEPPIYVREGKPSKKGEFKKIEDWWQETFQEERYLLSPGELDEWKANSIAQVEEFFHYYSLGFFPQKTINCAGRNWKCQYYDVCSTFPVEDRLKILGSGLYKTKEPRMPN